MNIWIVECADDLGRWFVVSVYVDKPGSSSEDILAKWHKDQGLDEPLPYEDVRTYQTEVLEG